MLFLLVQGALKCFMKVNPDPNIVVQQSWVNVGKMKQVNWDYSARAKATELSE